MTLILLETRASLAIGYRIVHFAQFFLDQRSNPLRHFHVVGHQIVSGEVGQELSKGDTAHSGFQEQQRVMATRLTLQRLQGDSASIRRRSSRQPFVHAGGWIGE